MSDDVQGTATSQDPENQKSSPIKRALLATEGKFAFVKGLTFIGFLGTLIAAYFQYLTAYEDKVATQAKEDLTAATAAFTDTSTALSVPIMLQAAHSEISSMLKAAVIKTYCQAKTPRLSIKRTWTPIPRCAKISTCSRARWRSIWTGRAI